MIKSLTNKLHLKHLYSHRMSEGLSLSNHLSVFKEIVADLETMEVKYDEEDLGLILLCLLPQSYTTFRDTILYSRDTLTLEEEYEALFSKEKMKHLLGDSETQPEGLVARGRNQERTSARNENKYCKYCKRKGHAITDCYKLQNKNKATTEPKGKQQTNFGQVSVAEDSCSDGELLTVSDDHSKSSQEWILDSGWTFHKDWFSTYETMSNGTALMGNNASCKIAGPGIVRIKMFDGVVRTLGNVKHAPDLKRNLISLGTLDSKGYKYTGEGGVLKVSKGALIVMKGQRKTANLYVLQGTTVIGDAAVVSNTLSDDDVTKLWHMPIGHMSENGMTELSRRGLLNSQSISKLEFCEHCLFGKQKRVKFMKGIHNTKGMLDYLHSDLEFHLTEVLFIC